MAQKVYLEAAAIVKLQQMVSDEIQATENVIDRYAAAGHSTCSLEYDLETLKNIDYGLRHSQSGN